jgi:uncharacterized protein YggU (UPF0235/DUF167 family)
VSSAARGTGFRFAVRLTPKSGADRIEGWAAGADGKPYLKARVSAPPEDGKANAALLKLLAGTLGIAKTKLRIVSGTGARIKLIAVEGDPARLTALGKLASLDKLAPLDKLE